MVEGARAGRFRDSASPFSLPAMRDRLHLTFPRERIPEPVVCEVAKQFDIVFSIRRANVEAASGWMDLQIDGEEAEIERVIDFLEARGIRVDPIEGDIIAG